MSRVCLVANPAAGGAHDEVVDRVSATLAPLGAVEIVAPGRSGEGAAALVTAARAADVVVIAGGDGTLSHAVNALAGQLEEVVFGLVPLGTGNDLARTLGLPRDPVAAAQVVVEGRVRDLDLGRARGPGVERLFVNACIGGFPVEVDEVVADDLKRRVGPFAFWIAGAKVATELPRTTVTLNGVVVPDCVAAGVGNGRTCGGGLPVWPAAEPDDGLLDGCALGSSGHAAALRLGVRLRAGTHEGLDGVATARAAAITLDSEPPIGVNVDGDLVGLTTPATFEIMGRLRVRV